VSVEKSFAESSFCVASTERVAIFSPAEVETGPAGKSRSVAASGSGVGTTVSVASNRYLKGVSVFVGSTSVSCPGNQTNTRRKPMPSKEIIPIRRGIIIEGSRTGGVLSVVIASREAHGAILY
jgi:hypothetical protein